MRAGTELEHDRRQLHSLHGRRTEPAAHQLSSPSVETTKTRIRWSGVRITPSSWSHPLSPRALVSQEPAGIGVSLRVPYTVQDEPVDPGSRFPPSAASRATRRVRLGEPARPRVPRIGRLKKNGQTLASAGSQRTAPSR